MRFITIISLCLLMALSCQPKPKPKGGLKTVDTDTVTVKEDAFEKSIQLAAFSREIQAFKLRLEKEQTVKGKKGTVITVPAHCFGNNVKSVTLELIECYSIQDMLLNGLTTLTHDEKLLESEGMIYINALDENGDTLGVKNGQIQVEMTTPQREYGFDLFEGIIQNEQVIWKNAKFKLKESLSVPIGEDVHNGRNEPKVDLEIPEDSVANYQITYSDPKVVLSNGKEYKIKDRELARYYFMVSNLGWFNIDRLRSFPTSPLAVNVAPAYQKAIYYIVLKNYNSLLGNDHKPNSKGHVMFPQVPDSEPFTLIGFGAKDGELYFHMEDYEANPGSIDFPALEPITQYEMSQKLLEKFGKDIWSRPTA